MREIKFRAWDGKEMFYPNVYEMGVNSWNGECSMSFCPDILGHRGVLTTSYIMQYTGLKDKNGVEIYEGDILEHPTDKQKFVVKWLDASSSFRGVYRDSDRYGGMLGLQVDNKGMAVVIGNIYENPELLK